MAREANDGSGGHEVPLGQRIYDNWMFWLVAGLVVMLVTYTGWGLWEIARLPQAPLP